VSRLRQELAQFFDQIPLTRDQVVGYRFIFFTTIAVDAWLRIPFATRPGLCGFNVAHFEWLDPFLPTPTPLFMRLLQFGQLYLALGAAVGLATRGWLQLLTALYGVSYFISVSDSYAHHYLGFLLVGMWTFTDQKNLLAVRWPFRLMLVQYGIVYFWAAVGKITPGWISGEMMFDQELPSWMRLGIFQLSQAAHLDIVQVWGFIAQSVVITEMLLAFAITFNAVRPLLFLVGVGLHFFILFLELRIGQFSWFMFCAYALVLPDAWRNVLVKLLRRIPVPAVGWDRVLPRWLAALVGVAAVLPLLSIPLDGMALAAAFFVGLLVLHQGAPTLHRLALHVAACTLVVGLAMSTSVVKVVLEGLGVGLFSCNQRAEAQRHLDLLVKHYPDYPEGQVYAGEVRLAENQLEAARPFYERALALDPNNATARQRLDNLPPLATPP